MEKTITILLLGETGVGKSTFINSFVNYLSFNTMEEAVNGFKCLIPTQITVFDKRDKTLKEVYFDQTDPENNRKDEMDSWSMTGYKDTDSNHLSTKQCKSYTFRFEGFTLKIIDTPGIGTSERDVLNANTLKRNLLSFISQYKEINGFCVFLKPNNTRVSLEFRFCILEILSHLSKSAQDNIVFIFTNTRGTFYQPGDTAPTLIEALDEIKSEATNVEIKFEDQNTFCFDNEEYKYLVAVSQPNNLIFDQNVKTCYEESWKRSVTECKRLLSYIKSLKPHLVGDTVAVNDVRETIIILREPIQEITTRISEEIKKYENQRKIIKKFISDLQELKKESIIGFIADDIVSTPLEKPITVCIDPKCCEQIIINGEKKVHYKSICHKRCYLKHNWANVCGNIDILNCEAFIKYEDPGNTDWINCSSMSLPDQFDGSVSDIENTQSLHKFFNRTKSEICLKCGHSFHTHMQSTVETKIVRKEIRDERFNRITNNEELVETQRDLIKGIESKIFVLKNESKAIADISAKLDQLFRNNVLIPYNFALEDYLKYLISQRSTYIFDWGSTETLECMLKQYQSDKQIILNAIEREESKSERISSEDINEKLSQLFNLKNYGQTIEYQFESQKRQRDYTFDNFSFGKSIVIECEDSENYSEWGH